MLRTASDPCLNTFLILQGQFECRFIAAGSEREQGAYFHERFTIRSEPSAKFDEQLSAPCFPQPKATTISGGLHRRSRIICFDEPANHRPVFVALCLFRRH